MMEKKTIGRFIAALRRSQGLTQQDIADTLNVSNKTVSKWERDESSPDISLIPAIAELFSVTCDEILLGERKTTEESLPESRKKKVEKLLRHILRAATNKFKNMSLLSLLLTLTGIAVSFGVSYAFFKPVLGFALGVIFFSASAVFVIISYNTASTQLASEDFSDESILFLHTKQLLRRWLFWTVYADISAFLLSTPFILVRDEYFIDSVIAWDSYLTLIPIFFFFMATILVLGLLIFGKWLGHSISSSGLLSAGPNLKRMNKQHLLFLGLAWLIPIANILCNYFYHIEFGIIILIPWVVLIAASIVITIVYTVKYADERKIIIFAAIRNLLLFVAVTLTLSGVSYGHSELNGTVFSNINFDPKGLWAAFILFTIVSTGYLTLKRYILQRGISTEKE